MYGKTGGKIQVKILTLVLTSILTPVLTLILTPILTLRPYQSLKLLGYLDFAKSKV
jgi:hypothetical protein